METFVIGDIEDSPQAFRDACECISAHPNARLIFLGDIYHPHTSSETIANAETILSLLGIRIRQFFLEGVTLEPSEYRRHSERISQAFRDLYLQKELEKYTPTDKLRFQIFTSDKPIKKSSEDEWKHQRTSSKDSNHGYAQYPDKTSPSESETTPSSSTNIHEHQSQDEVYNATRTLRLNCEYKLWREVQEDDEGPIFLFGNKEIDLMRDLAELNMAAVDDKGTIFYDIEYFRNKRRKTISQSLTIHEVNVLLTYLSLCEDAVVLGKTLFTHIYVNARQIYYHAHQFNTSYDIPEQTQTNSLSADVKASTFVHKEPKPRLFTSHVKAYSTTEVKNTNESVFNIKNRSIIATNPKPLPSLENPCYYKASSIDKTHPSVNYYMNKHYNHDNKRFIHVVVGHSKCFGSFFDPEHLEIQITMLDITGDTSFDPEHPHGRTGPVEIGFKNYIKFTPCISMENRSLVAHIIFNSTDPLIQEMLKFKLPAKQLFLTSKPSPMISVIDFYRTRREYYLQKLEMRNIQRNLKASNNTEDSDSFQRQLREARSFQPLQHAHTLGSWRKSSHKRAISENVEQTKMETVEQEPILQRRPSICLAEMDMNTLKIIKEISEDTQANPYRCSQPKPSKAIISRNLFQSISKTGIDGGLSSNEESSKENVENVENVETVENAETSSNEQTIETSANEQTIECWKDVQPYELPLKSEEQTPKPMKNVRFDDGLIPGDTKYLDLNPMEFKQVHSFTKPFTFTLFDEHKSDSISNDTSSRNESAPSDLSQEDDMKPDSSTNETTDISEEQLPSSLKLEKTFDLSVGMINPDA